MLLTIDLGNSHIVSGVFKEQELRGVWRLATDHTKTPDEYGVLFSSLLSKHDIGVTEITDCIMTSVVPRVTSTLEIMVESFFHQRLTVVSCQSPHGLTLRYDHPEEIGTDRLVNAATAFDRYRRSLIIVDFGTATTLCAITETANYLGGVIAPGLKGAAESLFFQTAKLPMVDLVPPKAVIGTNTATGMQSGLIFGHAGLVDELVRRIQGEMGKEAFVLATGGWASLVSPFSRTIQEVRPNLTLEGLELVHRRLRLSCG